MDSLKDQLLFISHSSRDRKETEEVVKFLRSQGYTRILVDYDDFKGNFLDDMEKAVGSCDRMIAIVTSNYWESDYCRMEFEAMVRRDPRGTKRSVIMVLVKPTDIPFLYRGRIYINLEGKKGKDRKKHFISELKRLLKDPIQDPQSATLIDKERLGEDVEYFTEIIKSRPIHPDAYFDRGESYELLGRYSEAVDDYTQAIKLGVFDLGGAYFNRGWVYAKLWQLDKALEDCKKAIQLDRDAGGERLNRGLHYVMAGQFDKAIAYCNQAVDLDTTDGETFYRRGYVYDLVAQYDKALINYLHYAQLSGANTLIAVTERINQLRKK